MSEEIKKDQKESIKLTKNAKGEYQWEIKVFGSSIENELNEKDLERLYNLNEDLQLKYGK